jgi:hypothetical protein
VNLLAETVVQASEAIPSAGLVAVIGAVSSLVIGIIGKIKVDQARNESRDVTLKPPVPTVRTQEEPEFVTIQVFNGHLRRIEESFQKIELALDSERSIARTANGNIHKRIDAMSERMGERLSKLEGITEGIAKTTATLLDIELGKKPATR